MISRDVDTLKYSGACYIVNHKEKEFFESCIGLADIDEKSTLNVDTIFRL